MTVYFARSGYGPIKIGYSRNIRKRLRNLKSQMQQGFYLVAVMPGLEKTERRVHRRFRDLAIGNEFFEPGERLLSFISGLETGSNWESRTGGGPYANLYKQLGKRDVPAGRRPK